MSEPPRSPQRFTRVPRPRGDTSRGAFSRAKFRDSLAAISTLHHHAVTGGRAAFTLDSPPYAAGSMVIIRMAALFETDEFADFVDATPELARRGIITMRNIAAHVGYRAMDDSVFWETLTTLIPPLLDEWNLSVQEP